MQKAKIHTLEKREQPTLGVRGHTKDSLDDQGICKYLSSP
jgi:hypothetical protein